MIWFTIAAVMALAASLTLAVYRSLTHTADRAKFDEALAIIQSSELDEFGTAEEAEAKAESQGWSWNRFWLRAARQAGRVPDDIQSPGRLALGALVIGAVFGYLVFPGGPGGVVIGFALIAVAYAWLAYEANKRSSLMDTQMPLLLSSLRSQMHAGVTVQGALMNVADDLPSPLGDEVRMVKRDVNVSIPLEQALETLALRVKSRQMHFLISSIGIAVRSGSDLVPQLITIEEISQQRARIEGKIRSAVALAKPTAILAAAAPPAMMVFLALSDENYLSYFFGSGLLMFGIAIVLYVAGLFVVRLMIQSVENT
jgi:tight adherence protein B